jgi:cytochrome c oxidase subunit 3
MNTKTSQQVINFPVATLSMHPKKFAMWLFIVSVVMIFASLTSAYIVRESEGNWLEFSIPDLMYISTGIILLSSISMHWAFAAARKDQLESMKLALAITTVLGLGFLVTQWLSWGSLVESGVYFVGNPAGSFIYVLSGLHGFHLVSALIFLLVVLYKSFKYKVHSRKMLSMEMCTTYWHFLDGLWIYLFIFLVLNH